MSRHSLNIEVLKIIGNYSTFQPSWALSAVDLPSSPADVYTDYFKFLETVAAWIEQRAKLQMKRKGLACEVIRLNGNKIWGGVGVYTVSELFFDSGMTFKIFYHY